jgi:hypothetical protein
MCSGGGSLRALLLTKRFGNLPPRVEQRLAEATVEQLEAWFDTGITAATLDEVFGDAA